MKKLLAIACATCALLAPGAVQASPTTYANPGVVNSATYTFTASLSGDLVAYFAGSDAGFTNELGLLVNGIDTGIYGLNNHASNYGDMLNFGHVAMGDTLVFILNNLNPGNVGPWYSDTSLNTDGVNHVFSSAYAGDAWLPAGPYVSFEDLPGGGDLNYTDESFVFANVSTTVPEPATAAVMGLGLALLGLSRRRRG